MTDAEISLIMRTLAESVKTYEQVVEVCISNYVISLKLRNCLQLLSSLLPHGGGLTHLGFALFHQKEAVREATIDLFNQVRAYPVGVCRFRPLLSAEY